MLQRVLVATDGSERAARAEALAARLAMPAHSLEIELFYVYPQLPPRGVQPDRNPEGSPWCIPPVEIALHVAEQARELLSRAEFRVRQASGPAEVRIWARYLASHDVAGWIVHEADRAGADVIVLGGRAHDGLSGLLSAGVCAEVLRRARRPVVLVP